MGLEGLKRVLDRGGNSDLNLNELLKVLGMDVQVMKLKEVNEVEGVKKGSC